MKNKKVQNSPTYLVTGPVVENTKKKKFIFKYIFLILCIMDGAILDMVGQFCKSLFERK